MITVFRKALCACSPIRSLVQAAARFQTGACSTFWAFPRLNCWTRPSPAAAPLPCKSTRNGTFSSPESIIPESRSRQSQLHTSGVYSWAMANVDKHPAGSFCWVELATTDQTAAKNFYTSLFGWSVVDSPIGPDDFYSMFKLSGRDTGAAYTMRKEQRAQGGPPHWMVYIAVENADQSVSKAAQAGGTVLAPAFDVMDVAQEPPGHYHHWRQHFLLGRPQHFQS